MKLNEEIRSSIFDRLFAKYLCYLISASEAGKAIRPGMTPEAVRTAIHRKKFPLPCTKVMGVQTVRLQDLASFLAQPSIIFENQESKSELALAVSTITIEKKARGQRGPGKRREQLGQGGGK